MKQRRESIEVAEILSLVPQLEEKYSSLEREKEKAFKRITMSSVAVREEDNYRRTQRREEKEKAFESNKYYIWC